MSAWEWVQDRVVELIGAVVRVAVALETIAIHLNNENVWNKAKRL